MKRRDSFVPKQSKDFENEIKTFVKNLGPIEDVIFTYTIGYIPKEHKSWAILVPYNSEFYKVESGEYDNASELRALDKLHEEFKKAGYNSFIENDYGHIKVFEKSKIKDSTQTDWYESYDIILKGSPIIHFKDALLGWEYHPATSGKYPETWAGSTPEEYEPIFGDYDASFMEIWEELAPYMTDEENERCEQMYETKEFDKDFLLQILDKYLATFFKDYELKYDESWIEHSRSSYLDYFDVDDEY